MLQFALSLSLASIMFIVPLALCPFTADPFIVKTIYPNIIIALLIVIFLMRYAHGFVGIFSIDASFVLAVIYALSAGISWLFAKESGGSQKYLIQLWMAVLLFLYVKGITDVSDVFKKVLILWSLSLIISFFIVFEQFMQGRAPSSTFGNKNAYGAFLVLSLPIIICRMLSLKNTLERSLHGVAGFVSIIGLSMTKSWGAWLGCLLDANLILFLLGRVKKPWRFLSFLSVVASCSLFLIPCFRDSFYKQVAQDIRPYIWEGSISMILEHPFWGVGPGQYILYFPTYRPAEYFMHSKSVPGTCHAHSEFIEIACEQGITGLAIFCILLGTILVVGYKFIRRETAGETPWLLIGVWAGIVSMIFHNLFDLNMRFASSYVPFWLCLGLLSSVTNVKVEGDRKDSHLKRKQIQRICISLFGVICISWALAKGTLLPLLSQIRLKKAVEERERGQYQRAVSDYAGALALDPSLIEARYKMAYAYALNRNPTQALIAYEQCSKEAPHFGNVHKNMGLLYASMEQYKEAAKHFLMEQSINPFDVETRLLYAQSLYRAGYRSPAVRELKIIFKMRPSFAAAIAFEKRIAEEKL